MICRMKNNGHTGKYIVRGIVEEARKNQSTLFALKKRKIRSEWENEYGECSKGV